jgi:hypothetical protein
MAKTADSKVTRADIETKLRQIRGEAQSEAESARSGLVAAAAGGAAVVVVVAFFLGRRRGRRSSTVVEIRRV